MSESFQTIENKKRNKVMNLTSQKAGELLSENMRTLYLWSLHKVSDPYKAEDLCSDIILAVMQSAPNLRADDAFFGFVWKVAANTYKAYLRKNAKSSTVPLDEDITDDSDVLGDLCDAAQLNTLRRELAFMSHKYRICTVAYYFDGLSCKEIAEKYGIIVENVKFNLFKSRKILKEGIAMERQFGEKSFKPSAFRFTSILRGDGNNDFQNLFNRMLPGQILLSAYYVPMTVEQLSVELGVASVYLEDEVKLLEMYGFLKKHGEKKYQTNLLILTKGYIDSIFDKLDAKYSDRLKGIIDTMRTKLPAVRKVGFTGCGLTDNLLLWDIFAYSCIQSFRAVDNGGNYKPLYGKTSGVCYAHAYEHDDIKYPFQSFSGNYNYNGHIGSKINFNGHRWHEGCTGFGDLGDDETYNGDFFPTFEKEELIKVIEILKDEFESMESLMAEIAQLSIDTLKEHSPECAHELIDAYCPHITIWNLCGWFGAAAESTGALERPAKDEFAGIIGYKYEPWL